VHIAMIIISIRSCFLPRSIRRSVNSSKYSTIDIILCSCIEILLKFNAMDLKFELLFAS